MKTLVWVASVMALGTVAGMAQPPEPPPAAAAATNGIGPKIQFASLVHDFGRARSGESIHHTYTFTNTGDATLIIKSVQPQCGCTAAGEWTRQVEPGQAGRIPIQFNTHGYNGPVFKQTTVNCNVADQPAIFLQIKGTVYRPIEFTPPMTVLNISPDEDVVSALVTITNNTDEPLALTAPESNNRIFAAELKTNVPGKGYQLTVTTVPPLPMGNVQGQISLRTGWTNPMAISFPVVANVRPAVLAIREELGERIAWFEQHGKLLEAQRIKMRTEYDLEMLEEMGFCSGIENYSRHIAGRPPGSRPCTLFDFFPADYLLVIDESHATVPQIGGMYNGDRSRKTVLVDYGFRLPSALDNRPLNFAEFQALQNQVIYASATPGAQELEWARQSALGGADAGEAPARIPRRARGPAADAVVPGITPPGVVELVVRPTGLVDPKVTLKPLTGQIDDLIHECRRRAEAKERVLVTTLTKRTAEELTDYLREIGIQVQYLHSEIDAIERVEILRALRKGEFDVLVGINLLREGLDLPEVSLVAILDADKEGFLRSETSLIQTAGRAARHLHGEVILYADIQTQSIQRFLAISEYRRQKQLAYNAEHHITPRSVNRAVEESLSSYQETTRQAQAMLAEAGVDIDLNDTIRELEEEMLAAANNLEFEKAALLRDQVRELRRALPDAPPDGKPKPGAARPVSYRKRKRKPA